MAKIGNSAAEYEHLKRAALDLAQKGYAVLPLPAVRGARRAVGRCVCELGNTQCAGPSTRCQHFGLGHSRASRDLTHIESWWADKPLSRVGLALGRASGLAALLVQGRHGLKCLEEFEFMNSKLPHTPTICSAGGEFVHLFAVHPNGVPNGRTHLAAGLWALGEGEIVMVPPSVQVDGDLWEELTWDPGATLNQTVVEELPDWILSRCELAPAPPPPARHPLVPEQPVGDEPALRFRTGFEIAADTSTVWINKPWVAVKAITLLHGSGKGSGRTTFALHLIRSVLEGSQFLLERSVQGPVVLLTSESPASLGKAIHARGYGGIFLERLHTLSYQDAVGASWPAIMQKSVDKCRSLDGRLIVIDRLNVFAARDQGVGRANVDGKAIMQPLLRATHQGIGVLAVWDLNEPDDPTVRMPTTPLDAFADIKLHLEVPGESSRERVIIAQSRFDETPRKSLILLRKEGFEYVLDQPGLFQEARGTAVDLPPGQEDLDLPRNQMPLFPEPPGTTDGEGRPDHPERGAGPRKPGKPGKQGPRA